MAFLPGFNDIGSGLSSVWNNLTGQTKAQQLAAAQAAQVSLQNQVLAAQEQQAQLQFNPVLVAEKNKQILIVVIGVIGTLILLRVFKII